MTSSFKKFDLSKNTALITGGAGLLGMEHAAALLENGATVILTDVNQPLLSSAVDQLKKNFDAAKISTHIMDVTRLESIRQVADNLQSQKQHVDILINNAAIDPKIASTTVSENSRLENFSLEQWNLQIAVGLTGAFLCSQVFGSLMAYKKGGVILNIASDLSVMAPDQRLYTKKDVQAHQQPVKPVTYSVIKTGLIGLTRYLSTYWADSGVRANALSPGGVFNDQPQEFVTRLNQLIPLGRMATRDEYRCAIQFLCSDASAYLNGQNIVMDGGRSVW